MPQDWFVDNLPGNADFFNQTAPPRAMTEVSPDEPGTFAGGFAEHMLEEEPAALGATAAGVAMLAGAAGVPAGIAGTAATVAPALADLLTRGKRYLSGKPQQPLTVTEALDFLAPGAAEIGPRVVGGALKYVGSNPLLTRVTGAGIGSAAGTAVGHPIVGYYAGSNPSIASAIQKGVRRIGELTERFAPSKAGEAIHEGLSGLVRRLRGVPDLSQVERYAPNVGGRTPSAVTRTPSSRFVSYPDIADVVPPPVRGGVPTRAEQLGGLDPNALKALSRSDPEMARIAREAVAGGAQSTPVQALRPAVSHARPTVGGQAAQVVDEALEPGQRAFFDAVEDLRLKPGEPDILEGAGRKFGQPFKYDTSLPAGSPEVHPFSLGRTMPKPLQSAQDVLNPETGAQIERMARQSQATIASNPRLKALYDALTREADVRAATGRRY